jgi:hypothetical protein
VLVIQFLRTGTCRFQDIDFAAQLSEPGNSGRIATSPECAGWSTLAQSPDRFHVTWASNKAGFDLNSAAQSIPEDL